MKIHKEINVDIGNKCMLKCPACRRQHMYKGKNVPGKDITIDEWNKITDYFDHIILCGQISDPTHHKDLYSLIKIAIRKKKSLSISIASTFRPKSWFTKLFLLTKGKNVEWVFGIDGLPKDSSKYRINQDGEKLFEIMKLCAAIGNNTIWQYIVFNYNENNIEECAKISKDIGVTFRKILSSRWEPKYGMDVYKPKDSKNYLVRNFSPYPK